MGDIETPAKCVHRWDRGFFKCDQELRLQIGPTLQDIPLVA
jgi:hypothetical protein